MVKVQEQGKAMPRRGYPYSRCSTRRQGEEGDSLRRQDDWPRRVCTEQGWFYDDTYALVDRGRSGFHQKNLAPTAGLTRFLKLVERGRIAPGSVLIIENIDRLSRADVDVAYDLFRSILRMGIWICTRTPFRIYKRESGSIMDLMEPIWLMYLAYQESLKKSERVASAWEMARERAADGVPIPARPPCWLRRTTEGYEVREDVAATIRRAAELLQMGFGFTSCMRQLVVEGHGSPGRSGRWNEQFLAAVFRGRQIIGEYQPCRLNGGRRIPVGKPIRGFYPAILSEEEWLKIQASITARRSRPGRPGKSFVNLFTGMVRDAESRLPMAVQARTSSTHGYRYLSSEKRGGASVRYELFEAAVLDTLAMLRPQDVSDQAGDQSEREQRIASLTQRLVMLEQRADEIRRAIEDPENVAGVASLAKSLSATEEAKSKVARERDRLKMEVLSGRTEALAEAQTLTQLRKATQGPERVELDRRIKAALPTVVAEIWVQCQPVSARHQIAHVQIFLHNGSVRYVQLLPPNLHGARPWQLANWDLRKAPYSPRRDACDTARVPSLA